MEYGCPIYQTLEGTSSVPTSPYFPSPLGFALGYYTVELLSSMRIKTAACFWLCGAQFGHESQCRKKRLLQVLSQLQFTVVVSQSKGGTKFIFINFRIDVNCNLNIEIFLLGEYKKANVERRGYCKFYLSFSSQWLCLTQEEVRNLFPFETALFYISTSIP